MKATYAFWAVALVVSLLRGVYAESIFGGKPKDSTPWSISHVWSSPAHAHQAVFNFAGSAVGWVALWGLSPLGWFEALPPVTWGSAVLVTTAFAGITGYLPLLFWKALEGVAALVLWAKTQVEGFAKK